MDSVPQHRAGNKGHRQSCQVSAQVCGCHWQFYSCERLGLGLRRRLGVHGVDAASLSSFEAACRSRCTPPRYTTAIGCISKAEHRLVEQACVLRAPPGPIHRPTESASHGHPPLPSRRRGAVVTLHFTVQFCAGTSRGGFRCLLRRRMACSRAKCVAQAGGAPPLTSRCLAQTINSPHFLALARR